MKPQEFFRKLKAQLPQIENRIANDIIAVEAEAFHAKNFRDEAFTDTATIKWPARKKKEKGRALLVKTGALRRAALKGRVQGDTVAFIVPLNYAEVHNEGGRSGPGAGFKMPKRKFIGESEYLNKRIEDKAKRFLDQYLNRL